MFKNRYFISYTTTSLLYIAIAGGILYIPSSKLISNRDIDTKVIKLSVDSFVPEVITPIEQVEQKEEQKEPVREEVKEEIKEEIKPEPIITPTPKPIVKEPKKIEPKKPIVKKKKKIVKKPKKPNKIKKRTKKVSKNSRVKKVASRRNVRVSPAKKSAFLSKIRAKINRAKSYPNIARRRGIEGRVRVSFKILSSGRVGAISVSGARAFHNSAKSAVRRAFPINPKNAPISLPMSINLTLVYKIR